MIDHKALAARTRHIFDLWHSSPDRDMIVRYPDRRRCCLAYAKAGCVALSELGVPNALGAGTAYWPIVNQNDPDDGISAQRYGYDWHASPYDNQYRISLGVLPELHAWTMAFHEGRVYILDLTPRYFTELAAEVFGLDLLKMPVPPDYLWHDSLHDLAWGVKYHMDHAACDAAYAFWPTIGIAHPPAPYVDPATLRRHLIICRRPSCR